MIIIKDINNIPELSSAVLTIGFFDGFHLGHRKIIDTLLSLSIPNKKTIVVTFTNHPISIICPSKAPKMISPTDYKIEFLKQKGIDYLILLDFTDDIMRLKPIKFINYFTSKIRLLDFVVGSDFRFGYKNEGDINFLKNYSIMHFSNIMVVPPVIKDGFRVSSSLIRKLISEGKIKEANRFLGRDFFIEGIVEHGDGKGKNIGFPTVNIKLDNNIIAPKFGVYKGNVFIDNKIYDCFIFISDEKLGRKIGGIIVEAFIKDFNGDLYGKKIRISFKNFIRGVIKFDNENDLKNQILKDLEFTEK